MNVLLLSNSPEGEIEDVTNLLAKSFCADIKQLSYTIDSNFLGLLGPVNVYVETETIDFNKYDLIVLGIENLDRNYVKAINEVLSRPNGRKTKFAYFYVENNRKRFANRMLLQTLESHEILGSLAITNVTDNYQKYVIPIVQWANNIVSKCA